MESRAVARFGIQPDASSMTFDDFAADGQADAGAGILLLGMESLKDDEDAIEVLGLDTNPVVVDVEDPFIGRHIEGRGVPARLAFGGNLDERRGGVAELERVGDEILEK